MPDQVGEVPELRERRDQRPDGSFGLYVEVMQPRLAPLGNQLLLPQLRDWLDRPDAD